MNIADGAMPSYGIKASHLERKASLYIRQSTNKQVVQNIGSTEYQRGLADHLVALGWSRERLELVEDDLGRSGRDITRRPGYRRIVAQIEAGEIGILAMSAVERGGREAIAWFLLFNLCRDHDVLVSIDGRIHDMSDRNNRVMLKLAAVLAENDSEMRTENFMRGRIAKAKMGAVVSPVPTGYIRQRDGSMALDPTPGVAEAIRRVFAEYLRQGSLVKTVAALRAANVPVPGRRLGEEVKWPPATRGNVRRILRNVTYSGDYHFGKTRLAAALGFMDCGAPRWRRTSVDERIITTDHHPTLVSREDFERVQRMLTANNCAGRGTRIGFNETLLQGIAVCAVHGSRLEIHYGGLRRDGTRQHFYVCPGRVDQGDHGCAFVRGRPLDSLVRAAFLERLEAPRLKALEDAVKRLGNEVHGERFRRESEINRHRQRVATIKYRYEKTDPDNHLVFADTARELEAALRDLDRVSREPASEPPIDGGRILEDAFEIAGDLPGLFDAPTTSPRERKELLGALIARVLVGPCSRERSPIRIEWVDGTLPVDQEAGLVGFCERRAFELRAQGHSYASIAATMNAEGLRTRNDTPWTREGVAQAIRRAMKRDVPEPVESQMAVPISRPRGRGRHNQRKEPP